MTIWFATAATSWTVPQRGQQRRVSGGGAGLFYRSGRTVRQSIWSAPAAGQERCEQLTQGGRQLGSVEHERSGAGEVVEDQAVKVGHEERGLASAGRGAGRDEHRLGEPARARPRLDQCAPQLGAPVGLEGKLVAGAAAVRLLLDGPRDEPEVFRARGYMVCLRLRDRRLCGDQVGGARSRVGTSPCPIR